MTKLSFLVLAAGMFMLTSCELTREITLTDNGSGTLVTTSDMSPMIAMAKMYDKDNKMAEEKAVDTTVMLASMVDSIPDLTPQEKELLKTGKLDLQIDMAKEKFLTRLHFDFKNTDQLNQLHQLSQKVTETALKKQAGGEAGAMPGGDDMPDASIDNYYATTYSKGVIEKKLLKDKYAEVSNDKGMEALKQVGAQGMAVSNTTIFNLPRPAKKAEGKNVKLSEDKKKVTITGNSEDFFDDPSKLEFRIEY